MAQVVEEKNIAREELSQNPDGLSFDYRVEYSDEFYEKYISEFEQTSKKKYFFRFVKRTFDIFASGILLLLCLPLFAVIAIAIKCDSKGPIIFKQPRIGKGGKEFMCLKFRSMYVEAPKECATHLLKDPERYYTKVGKFLRKTSLDELPQFWCVFIGKMSFIGYRPLILNETECNDMRARLGVYSMRPGISGYAQVRGRDDLHFKNKALLDAEYVKNASIWLDIKLCFKTVDVVLRREGNDAGKKTNEAKEEAKV